MVKERLQGDRSPEGIRPHSIHIDIIADYGGEHIHDPAFTIVRNRFFQFDPEGIIRWISETPVYKFSTIETGFWLLQEARYDDHDNLVVCAFTAPRGREITRDRKVSQPFVYAILDNGIQVFATHAGYNLSLINKHIKYIYEVYGDPGAENVMFRARDYYPQLVMNVLREDFKQLYGMQNLKIPEVPLDKVASISGCGNITTSTRISEFPRKLLNSNLLKVIINGQTHLAYNTLNRPMEPKDGDLIIGKGSFGGNKDPFVEIIHVMGSAADDFEIDGPRDDLKPIIFEPV